MTEHKIFVIVAGKDELSGIFKKLGSASGKLGKDLKKPVAEWPGFDKPKRDTKGLGKAFDGLKGKATGLVGPLAKLAGGAAILGIGKVAISASLGAERFRNSLEGLAGGAKEATGFIEAIQGASLGTISQLDAMAISSKALSLKVVDNAQNMKDLTEVAITLGQAQGLTAKQSVDDLTTAIGRQSPLILDNLGITLKASEAQDIYAQSMDKTAADLTDLEKSQSFANAALIKGQEAAAKLGGVQLDSAAKMERLNAQMADSSIILGDALVPAFTVFVDLAAQALTTLEPLLTTFAEMTAGLAEMDTAIEKTNTSADGMGQSFAALIEGGASTGEAIDEMAARIDKANAVVDNMSNVQKFAATALGKTNEITGTVVKAQRSLNEEIASGSGTYKKYIDQINQFNKSTKNSESRLDAMSMSSFQWRKRSEEAAGAMADGATMTDLFTDSNNQAQIAFSEAIRQYAIEQGTLTTGIEETTQAQERSFPIWEQAARAADRQAAAQDTAGSRAEQMAATMDMLGQQIGPPSEALQTLGIRQEHAAASAERQASLTAKLAEQQAVAAATTAEFASSQQNLIGQLRGANEEAFKSQVLAQFDAADIGLTAYTELGQGLGLLDQKQVDLAASIPILTQAYSDGILPTENMAAATTALFEAAGTADFNTEALLDQFAKAPGLIGPSADATEDFAVKLSSMDEVVVTMTGNLNALADAFTGTASAAGSLPTVPGGAGGSIPAFQGGGVVPGSPRQAVPIIAHGGERFAPEGMVVGPTGPPRPAGSTTNFNRGGDTVILQTEQAVNTYMRLRQREDKLARHSARM